MSRRRGLRSASGIAVKHKPRHHLAFATLRLEGGLFLPDQLEKAALGAARFQSEADYRTPKASSRFSKQVNRRKSVRKPKRYTVHVNGPYCITFEWREGDAWRIDLENYHSGRGCPMDEMTVEQVDAGRQPFSDPRKYRTRHPAAACRQSVAGLAQSGYLKPPKD